MAQIGVAVVDFKERGSRLGLGSVKALGGVSAVARLLCQRLAAAIGLAHNVLNVRHRIRMTPAVSWCLAPSAIPIPIFTPTWWAAALPR